MSTEHLREAFEQLRMELRERERHRRNRVVLAVCEAVVDVLQRREVDRWNTETYKEFCQRMGLIDQDGKLQANDDELFRINVGLAYVLKRLTKYGLKVSLWPSVRMDVRQHLAFKYGKADEINSLWWHEQLVRRLVSRKPNYGTPTNELCVRFILAAIALDGVVIDNADGLLAGLHAEDVILGDMNLVRIPKRSGSARKNYYIGQYSTLCLKMLLPRAKKGHPLCPDGWQIVSGGGDKTERRSVLDAWIRRLWDEAFPGRLPRYPLTVAHWIRLSQLSLWFGGIPALVVADLSGKFRGAQIPYDSGSKVGEGGGKWRSGESNLAELHKLFPDSREGGMKTKLRKASWLPAKLRLYRDNFRKDGCSPNDLILLEWLIWIAEDLRFANLTLSTYRGYVSVVANRVFPLPKGKHLDELSVDDWEAIGRGVVSKTDYSPSSRRTAISHLRLLHEFLVELGKAPEVNFRKKCFSVPREIAECSIPFPHEVDALLAKLEQNESDFYWVATVCSFYLGMRCEEIANMQPEDLQDGYRLLVRFSKLESSRRSIPYRLLLPERIRQRFEALVARAAQRGVCIIPSHDDPVRPMEPTHLSKAMGRILQRYDFSVRKMHALRHGFASWQLVRYFMLVDKDFRRDLRNGRFHLELDSRHPWFDDESLEDLAEAFGGLGRCRQIERDWGCIANATDLLSLSQFLGHANRFTTLENYTNSIGWIGRYFLLRRERRFLESERTRRSI